MHLRPRIDRAAEHLVEMARMLDAAYVHPSAFKCYPSDDPRVKALNFLEETLEEARAHLAAFTGELYTN